MKPSIRIILMFMGLGLAVTCFAMERAETFTISGSTGLPGVTMQGLPGDPITNIKGYYSVSVEHGWNGTVTPVMEGFIFDPPTLTYAKVKSDMLNQNYAPRLQRLAPRYGRTTGRTDRGKVLVIPTTEVKPEEFEATRSDMQVMLYILEKELQKPRLIQGVFFDFGDFFDREGQALQAVYVQDYGAFFFTEVDFPLVFPAEAQEPPVETTKEQVDPIWQQAQQEMFSSWAPAAGGPFPGRQERGPETLEELKKDLTRLLKHACNIRNLKADEWVILTVIGAGGWIGENRMTGPSGATMGTRSKSAGGGMYGTGGYGGYGGGGGYGGYGGGSGGFGGSGGAGGMAGYGGMGGASFGYGAMTGFARTEAGPRTILTMRVKKSDVDAYAKGEINFEQFQQKVKILTY